MTQNANLALLAAELGVDIKALTNTLTLVGSLLNANAANLNALNTTNKASMVAALNEVLTIANAASSSGYSDAQADARVQAAKGNLTTGAADKWASTADIIAELSGIQAAAVTAAVNQITNGAGAAYDTLVEIQADLEGDQTVLDNLLAAIGKRVAVDQSQTFSTAEKAQACANLGFGDPATDFLAAYTTARDA